MEKKGTPQSCGAFLPRQRPVQAAAAGSAPSGGGVDVRGVVIAREGAAARQSAVFHGKPFLYYKVSRLDKNCDAA